MSTSAAPPHLRGDEHVGSFVPHLRGDEHVGAVLDARSSQVRALLVDGRLVRLAFPSAPRPGDVADARAGLIDENLEPAAEAVHARTRVGRRVLHGSIANAVVSSMLHMSWPDADRARYVPAARKFLAPRPDRAALARVDAVERPGERWMYTDRAACCPAFRTTVNQEREQLPRHLPDPARGDDPRAVHAGDRALRRAPSPVQPCGRSRRSAAAPRR